MKLTTATSGILCVLASFGLGVSVILPTWRAGVGTHFLKELPGMLESVTYDERHYGMLYVTGKYRLSWGTLARSACDKWTAIYGIAMLQGLIVDDSPCTPNIGSDTECPQNFANHMMDRCTEYTNMFTATKVFLSLVGIAFVFTLGSCLLLFLGSIKSNRELIFSLLFFADICLLVGTVYYVHVTDKGFKVLGKSSTYPYPSLAWSFWFFAACATIHFFAVMLFGWTKVMSKWIYGADRPSGWVPPGQRALLAGGPGSLPPGPVPQGWDQNRPSLQQQPPGPVPGGMAPAFGPPM